MKASLDLVVLLMCFVASACATGASQRGVQTHRIEAAVSTAGPYGQFWQIDLSEYRDGSGAELRFESSLGMGGGEIQGRVLLSRERLAAIKDLLASTSFSQLPSSITAEAVPFHRPDFRITSCSGSNCHTVNLYDPATVGESTEGRRFLSVWAAIVEPLPLKPAWQ